jgi:hypothetical protein
VSYEDSVCWHLLRGRHARVRTVVGDAQRRLTRFGGMHMTPARWLHATVLLAGPQAATLEVIGTSGSTESAAEAWTPHLTVSYSTGEQAAAPVIAELGMAIPGCEVTVDPLSLVVQDGPEQLWDWQVAGTVCLGGHGSPDRFP